jgi:hypothetical protein
MIKNFSGYDKGGKRLAAQVSWSFTAAVGCLRVVSGVDAVKLHASTVQPGPPHFKMEYPELKIRAKIP